jgi:hypothetical protein
MPIKNKMPKTARIARIVPKLARSLNALLQSGEALSITETATREPLAGTPFSFAKTYWILPQIADEHA